MYPPHRFLAVLFALFLTNIAAAVGATESVVTAVFSRSFNNYERPTKADGKDQPLTYVIAKGGEEPGMGGDKSMDDVKFAGIVRVLGKYLAKQAYFPAKDAKKADLMLVVHWGKTVPGNDGLNQNMRDQGVQNFATWQRQGNGIGRSPRFFDAGSALPASAATLNGGSDATAAANSAAVASAASSEMIQGLFEIRFAQDARIEADRHNANLLGYTAELKNRVTPTLYAGAGTAYYDLIEDIEVERYYISVTGYDFQEALQHKKNKGLWRTVVSIDARGNRFDEQLMAMIERASRYFGRDSGRLVRQFEYTPRVDLGELKSMGVVDQPTPQKK